MHRGIIITITLLAFLGACKRAEVSTEQSELSAVQAASAADNSAVESPAVNSPKQADDVSPVPSKPKKLAIKCMTEEDALALCKSGNLTKKIYDQSCNRKIWHLSDNCPDTEDWNEEEHYHNGEYDEPPEWLHEDCALVDENGDFVTGFQYWEINPIDDDDAQKNGKLLYSFANEKGDYGLFDAYGTELVPPQFHRIRLQNGYIIATVFKPDDSCVFEELNGRKVYDHAPAYQYCKNEDGEHSVFTPDGKLIIDYKTARDWFHKRHPDLSIGREFVEFTDDSINYRIESSLSMIPKLKRKGYFNYFSVRAELKYNYIGIIQTNYVVYESLYTSSYDDRYLKDISKNNADMISKLYPDTHIVDTIVSINENGRFITVTYSLRYNTDSRKTVHHSLYFDFELNPIDDLNNHIATIQKQREQ